MFTDIEKCVLSDLPPTETDRWTSECQNNIKILQPNVNITTYSNTITTNTSLRLFFPVKFYNFYEKH